MDRTQIKPFPASTEYYAYSQVASKILKEQQPTREQQYSKFSFSAPEIENGDPKPSKPCELLNPYS